MSTLFGISPAAKNWLTRFCSDETVALVIAMGVVASVFADPAVHRLVRHRRADAAKPGGDREQHGDGNAEREADGPAVVSPPGPLAPATGLTRRYQRRLRPRRVGGLAAANTPPRLLTMVSVSSAWSLALRPVSAVSGMDPPSDGANRV
jgi:hypothetical protein